MYNPATALHRAIAQIFLKMPFTNDGDRRASKLNCAFFTPDWRVFERVFAPK
jgi:hypothetical protein